MSFKTHLVKWVVKPLICIIGATCVAHMCFEAFGGNLFSPPVNLIFHILSTTVIYVLLLRVTNAFDKDDMAWAMGILRDRKSIKSDACDNLAEN